MAYLLFGEERHSPVTMWFASMDFLPLAIKAQELRLCTRSCVETLAELGDESLGQAIFDRAFWILELCLRKIRYCDGLQLLSDELLFDGFLGIV